MRICANIYCPENSVHVLVSPKRYAEFLTHVKQFKDMERPERLEALYKLLDMEEIVFMAYEGDFSEEGSLSEHDQEIIDEMWEGDQW